MRGRMISRGGRSVVTSADLRSITRVDIPNAGAISFVDLGGPPSVDLCWLVERIVVSRGVATTGDVAPAAVAALPWWVLVGPRNGFEGPGPARAIWIRDSYAGGQASVASEYPNPLLVDADEGIGVLFGDDDPTIEHVVTCQYWTVPVGG